MAGRRGKGYGKFCHPPFAKIPTGAHDDVNTKRFLISRRLVLIIINKKKKIIIIIIIIIIMPFV